MEYKDDILTIYRENDTPLVLSGEDDGGKDIIEVSSNAYFNEVRYFTDCVLARKPCDRIKPQELIDVLEMIGIIDN